MKNIEGLQGENGASSPQKKGGKEGERINLYREFEGVLSPLLPKGLRKPQMGEQQIKVWGNTGLTRTSLLQESKRGERPSLSPWGTPFPLRKPGSKLK